LEGAARVVWKDEGIELTAIGSALKQVETQVKLDKNEKFTATMGAFHSKAKSEFEKMNEERKTADDEATKMIKWLGEDAKTQPEDLFSQLHNFRLTLEKGHRYNLDCDEKEAKKARQEEAARKRQEELEKSKAARATSSKPAEGSSKLTGGSAPPRPLGKTPPPPPPTGSVAGGGDVSNELAAKLARRNQLRSPASKGGGRQGLVEGTVEASANGIRVRDQVERQKEKPKGMFRR